MHDGDFLKMAGDLAAMMPMIEMARDNFRFIPHVLLIYNAENVLNEYKISKAKQLEVDRIVRSRPRYDKIESPF